MPNPDLFYDRDGITIWHGDNTDVEWPAYDLLLADPPYGYGVEMNVHGSNDPLAKRTRGSVLGDDKPFDPMPFTGGASFLWGANHYYDRLPAGGRFVVWHKIGAHPLLAFAELAWTNAKPNAHRPRSVDGVSLPSAHLSEPNLHPTQKPVALMLWVIERWTEPGDLVFDPFMGSGPVAQACLELGRRYFGIELVEEYCQAAVDRLNRTTPSMFEVADAQS